MESKTPLFDSLRKIMKTKFVEAYVVAFLANHAAIHYDDACLRNQHKRFDNQPVEDAKYLAEKAWENWVRM